MNKQPETNYEKRNIIEIFTHTTLYSLTIQTIHKTAIRKISVIHFNCFGRLHVIDFAFWEEKYITFP